MRGVENIEGPSPSLGCMFATRSVVHVVETCDGGVGHCMYNLDKTQANLYIPYIYRKFTQLLVIRTKLANWPNWGINVEIATKSPGQIVGHPRFKTGQSFQNWPNPKPKYNTKIDPFQNCPQNWPITGQSHTSLQSHKHQKRCPPVAPRGTTGGTTITSETRKNPSH